MSKDTTRRYSKDPVFVARVIDLYVRQGLMMKQVSEQTGVTHDTIYRILRLNGVKSRRRAPSYVPRRSLPISEDYFKTIDNEERAYYLGLFYADGCVSRYGRSKCYRSCVSLTKKDSYILFRLAEGVFKGKRHLTFRKGRRVDQNDRRYTEKASASFTVYGEAFAKYLIDRGCTPRKSLTLQFPTPDQVPPHLLRHFIRGYFDGDGTVGSYVSDRTLVMSIVSSETFVDGLISHLEGLGISSTKRRLGKVYYALWANRNDIARLYDLMYEGQTICLERKRQKMYDTLQLVRYTDICFNLGRIWEQRFSNQSFWEMLKSLGLDNDTTDIGIESRVARFCSDEGIRFTKHDRLKTMSMRKMKKGDARRSGRSRV